MKLRSKNFIALLILCLLCIFTVTGCVDNCADNNDNVNNDTINRLHNTYNINTQLLHNFEIACDLKGETFTGRAPRYSLIVLKEKPTDFLNSFSKNGTDGFSSEKNSDIKNRIDAHTSLQIPNEYYPNWDDDYIWLVTGELDKLYIIYFANDFKLVFFETGH